MNNNQHLKVAICGINTRYTQSSLSLYYLSSYLIKHFQELNLENKLDIKCFEFHLNDTYEYIERELAMYNADVYCFSVYIWNKTIIERLITFLKTAFSDIITIVGGPEVISVCLGDFEAMCNSDFAISGEGEVSFAKLIKLIFESKQISNSIFNLNFEKLIEIEGIAINGTNLKNSSIKNFFYATEPAVIPNLNILPSLSQMHEIVSSKTNYSQANLSKDFVYLETSRGCPNSCSYCLSSLKPKNVSPVRYFDLKRIFNDIDYIINTLKIKKVRVIDRTFNENPKRALEIFRYIASYSNLDILFQFEINPYLLDDETLTFLQTINKQCFQFEIGIQSFNHKALEAINRNYNDLNKSLNHITHQNKILKILNFLINKTNVHVHADLIYGLPNDTFLSCINSFDILLNQMPHSVQFWQLKLLRGTKLRNEAKKLGLTYNPNPPYAVIKTNSINLFEMLTLQKLGRFLDILYNHGHIKFTLYVLFDFFKIPSKAFFEIIDFFENNNLSTTAISRQNLFKLIYDFSLNKIKPINEKKHTIICDFLRFDFILGETKKFSLPDYLKPEKINRDFKFYDEIKNNAYKCNFTENITHLKPSKSFSFFRFDCNILNVLSGSEVSNLKISNLNLNDDIYKSPSYLIVHHIVNLDGSFDAKRYWFNDEIDFLVLDYFNVTSKSTEYSYSLNFELKNKENILSKFNEKILKLKNIGLL